VITEIGKIKIKWEIKEESIRERILDHYRNFLSNGEKKEIEIKFYNKSFLFPSGIKFIVNTRSWEYLKDRDKFYFRFPRGENSSVAVIRQDFKKVEFFSPDKDGQLLLYLFPELLYSLILPEFRGILLHACGIKMKNRIFVFLAPSEGGKSTIAKLALKKGLTALNDDRIILRKIKGKYFAFGNPWHGEVKITSSDYGEIEELFFLEKAKRNYIQRIFKKDMFMQIIRNSFYLKEDKESLRKIVEIVLDIVDNINGYIFGFKPDLKIWKYLDERFK